MNEKPVKWWLIRKDNGDYCASRYKPRKRKDGTLSVTKFFCFEDLFPQCKLEKNACQKVKCNLEFI